MVGVVSDARFWLPLGNQVLKKKINLVEPFFLLLLYAVHIRHRTALVSLFKRTRLD